MSPRGEVFLRAEEFDPFGLKSSLKNTFAGLTDALQDEEPSAEDERMINEIFAKFDLDQDGILNLEEFNALQIATEGSDAVYNQEQLEQLLRAVNTNVEAPEKGMAFAEYRNLYIKRSLRQTYGTDILRDHVKIFGPGGGSAQATPPAAAAPMPEGFKDGMPVKIEGLASAVDLNGREGHVVTPAGDDELKMAGEGRVIVQLDDGERIALKPANVITKLTSSPSVD